MNGQVLYELLRTFSSVTDLRYLENNYGIACAGQAFFTEPPAGLQAILQEGTHERSTGKSTCKSDIRDLAGQRRQGLAADATFPAPRRHVIFSPTFSAPPYGPVRRRVRCPYPVRVGAVSFMRRNAQELRRQTSATSTQGLRRLRRLRRFCEAVRGFLEQEPSFINDILYTLSAASITCHAGLGRIEEEEQAPVVLMQGLAEA